MAAQPAPEPVIKEGRKRFSQRLEDAVADSTVQWFRQPLWVAYAFFWLTWNWEIVLILVDPDIARPTRVLAIENRLQETGSLLYPLGAAVGYLVFSPLVVGLTARWNEIAGSLVDWAASRFVALARKGQEKLAEAERQLEAAKKARSMSNPPLETLDIGPLVDLLAQGVLQIKTELTRHGQLDRRLFEYLDDAVDHYRSVELGEPLNDSSHETLRTTLRELESLAERARHKQELRRLLNVTQQVLHFIGKWVIENRRGPAQD